MNRKIVFCLLCFTIPVRADMNTGHSPAPGERAFRRSPQNGHERRAERENYRDSERSDDGRENRSPAASIWKIFKIS